VTTAAPDPLLAHHLAVLGRNLALLRRVTADIDDATARTPLIAGGSHLAWLLAHLVVSRDGILRRVGATPLWDEAARGRFGRGSSADGDDFPTAAACLEALAEQGERLDAALTALAAAPATDTPPDVDRNMVEFLVWHETYHVGQALLYRRGAGLASPIG